MSLLDLLLNLALEHPELVQNAITKIAKQDRYYIWQWDKQRIVLARWDYEKDNIQYHRMTSLSSDDVIELVNKFGENFTLWP